MFTFTSVFWLNYSVENGVIGQTISQYKILEKLGEGGMGVVYKAQDMKLDRVVALKFLPHHLVATEAEQARFLQEARAASALNHPNVCTIYDIKEEDGRQFIVMEYVDGATIKRKLPLSGLQEALAYALQIGEALHEAHEKGIVHRDIKCDNIMVNSKNQVKVMDFGLAKLKGSMKLTKTSSTVGTLAYMAPEQLQGGEVNARSDIFSYGVVLFEMLTGHIPFRGEHEAALMYSIVNEEPESALKYRQDLSPELDRIIRRALEKDPADRYQHVDDMVSELRRLRKETTRVLKPEEMHRSESRHVSDALPAGRPGPLLLRWILVGAIIVLAASAAWFLFYRTPDQRIISVAVLPFQNKSSDADTEYLSDGLTESLIYRLSQLPGLKVSPTSSVMRYKSKETDPIQAGKDLGVSAVMSGRIVQRGDMLAISVELVDVRNNNLLWGEQYERKLAELLSTQREIATEIAQKLQVRLSGEGATGLTKHYTENNDAYQLYLKGRYHFAKRTEAEILRAIECYRQAIALDPKFALAYARIAEAYNQMPSYPYCSPKEAFPQAKAAAMKALEIDPTLPEAHTALANLLVAYDWDWAGAEREFKKAIELDSNSSAPHFRYGQMYLSPLGRSTEAIAELKRALAGEPLDLTMGAILSSTYYAARQYDLALDQAKKTHDLEPNFVLGIWILCEAYLGNGMYAEAIALSEGQLKVDSTNQSSLQNAGYAYAKTGRKRDAEEMIRRLKELAKTRYVMSYTLATMYAALGEKDLAFSELEHAFNEHDWNLHKLNVDPFLDPLRSDPRFAALQKRVGLQN